MGMTSFPTLFVSSNNVELWIYMYDIQLALDVVISMIKNDKFAWRQKNVNFGSQTFFTSHFKKCTLDWNSILLWGQSLDMAMESYVHSFPKFQLKQISSFSSITNNWRAFFTSRFIFVKAYQNCATYEGFNDWAFSSRIGNFSK